MKEQEMQTIAEFILQALSAKDDRQKLTAIKSKVCAFTKRFPLYPELLKG